MFDLKKLDVNTMLITVVLVFIIMSLSSLSSIFQAPSPQKMRKMQREICDDLYENDKDIMMIEDFGNESLLMRGNESDTVFQIKRSGYKFNSTSLTAPSTENNFPTNLLFGRADRYVILKGDKKTFYLEVYCNLPIFGGDPFDKTDLKKIKQEYLVLLKKDNQKLHIGNLNKDGDGMYKLKIKNTEGELSKKTTDELMSYNGIEIVYALNNDVKLLLEGYFN